MKKPLDVALSTHSKGVPLTFSMGNPRCEKYCGHMKLRRVLATTIAAALIISINPAHAFDPNAPRVDQVVQLRATYDSQLDAAYANFLKLKPKLSLVPTAYSSYKAVIDDFVETRDTINRNLADPNSPAKTVEEYIQEELGEFSTSQFKLTQLAAKIKTISCVKGKVVKKVSALGTPKCPTGYKKK